MKRVLAVILVVVMILCLVACGNKKEGTSDAKDSTDPIYIASANPMTGDSAQYGECKVNAIKLAFDQVNAEGGINGRKLELLVGDDTGNPKEAPNVAQKFASNKDCLAVIGHWNSSCTLAARDIYEEAGIPVITDSVNKAVTTEDNKTMFRVSLTDTEQATALANYAYNVMNVRKVAIMYTANDFGTGLMTDFTAAFEGQGGAVTGTETYFEGQTKDFTPQLTKLKQTDAELMFVAGYYTECALIAEQRQNVGFDVPILGTDGISSEELINLGGSAVEGVTFAGFFHPDIEFSGTKKFVEAYRDAYGKDPDTYAALAYDSAQLIIAAIKENGATREGILNYLTSVDGFEGVAGPISFDEKGATTRNIVVIEVRDGAFVPAENQPEK